MVKMLNWRKPKQMDLEDYLRKLAAAGLTQDGKQIVSNVPIAPPIGYKRHPTMVEIMRDMIRNENFRRSIEEAGAETLEESDDFEVGDDPEVRTSGYEIHEADPTIAQLARVGREELERKKKEAEATPSAPPAPKPSPSPSESQKTAE